MLIFKLLIIFLLISYIPNYFHQQIFLFSRLKVYLLYRLLLADFSNQIRVNKRQMKSTFKTTKLISINDGEVILVLSIRVYNIKIFLQDPNILDYRKIISSSFY